MGIMLGQSLCMRLRKKCHDMIRAGGFIDTCQCIYVFAYVHTHSIYMFTIAFCLQDKSCGRLAFLPLGCVRGFLLLLPLLALLTRGGSWRQTARGRSVVKRAATDRSHLHPGQSAAPSARGFKLFVPSALSCRRSRRKLEPSRSSSTSALALPARAFLDQAIESGTVAAYRNGAA